MYGCSGEGVRVHDIAPTNWFGISPPGLPLLLYPHKLLVKQFLRSVLHFNHLILINLSNYTQFPFFLIHF